MFLASFVAMKESKNKSPSDFVTPCVHHSCQIKSASPCIQLPIHPFIQWLHQHQQITHFNLCIGDDFPAFPLSYPSIRVKSKSPSCSLTKNMSDLMTLDFGALQAPSALCWMVGLVLCPPRSAEKRRWERVAALEEARRWEEVAATLAWGNRYGRGGDTRKGLQRWKRWRHLEVPSALCWMISLLLCPPRSADKRRWEREAALEEVAAVGGGGGDASMGQSRWEGGDTGKGLQHWKRWRRWEEGRRCSIGIWVRGLLPLGRWEQG
jgi:hypothetical protein